MKTFEDLMDEIRLEMYKLRPFDESLSRALVKLEMKQNQRLDLDVQMVYARLSPESIACLGS